jgi:type IV pilus assembly protein PilW
MSIATSRMMRGVSLIELMIAMLIGLILLLGLVQVFSASRVAYQTSEGLARVQENGRFAMDFLQRDVRMAGHFGCVNDQARFNVEQSMGNSTALVSHFGPEVQTSTLNFRMALIGYEAEDTAPGDTWNLGTGSGNWNPAIPTGYTSRSPRAGSDVIVLRHFSGEGVPVTLLQRTASQTIITFDPAKWPVLTQNGVASPTLFGLSDCSYADVFEGDVDPIAGTITVSTTGENVDLVDSDERYTSSPEGQTFLYRAESVIYYVAENDANEPALYRDRADGLSEELVEGVESLQLLYGQDENPVNNLNGNITLNNTADNFGLDQSEWLRVGQVRIGLLMRSPSRAASLQRAAGNEYSVLGLTFATPDPNDGRYRSTYESTIALRNRLYGN